MSAGQPVRVVLVEDNPRDAELTIRALKCCGLDDGVVHLRDGQEALDFCLRGEFGAGESGGPWPLVMLLDLKLPKVSGLEVLRTLKSDLRTVTVPVVIFSSSREESDIEECYRLGVNSYVVKPAEYEKMSEIICQTATYWLQTNHRPRNPPAKTGSDASL